MRTDVSLTPHVDLVADVHALPFKPGTVDYVFALAVLEHLRNPFVAAASIHEALKPGGVLVIVDHIAQAGSEVRDTESLHRIDPAVIIRTVRTAGFVLEAQSDSLRNAKDTHELVVFDPAIRGHTDQVVLKFRKPRVVAALQPLS